MNKGSKSKDIDMDMGIGIGIGINQDQIDDIDDLQSPPNSPGLVLPGQVPSTNDSIDFFVLDSPSIPTDKDKNEANLTNVVKNEYFDSNSRKSRKVNNNSNIHNKDKQFESSSLNLPQSSDSYYSYSRKAKELSNIMPKKVAKNRRVSDVSDSSLRSDINSYGRGEVEETLDLNSLTNSYLTESDTDFTNSPLSKYSKRKEPKRKSISNDISDVSHHDLHHYDDDMVYRTLSAVSDESDGESLVSSPRSGNYVPRSRCSSMSTTRSRSHKSSKDKDGDGSSTSQIFKNMLILEESLRQQYIHQQGLRYKYSLFILAVIFLFGYSTYMSAFHSLQDPLPTVVNNSKSDNHNSILENIDKKNAFCDSVSYSSQNVDFTKINSPRFPVFSKHDTLVDEITELNNDIDLKGKEIQDDKLNAIISENSGFGIKKLFYRVISIITSMTLLLFYLSGEYTRTISRPRKHLVTANKGIRQLNVRLVKVKVGAVDRILAYLRLTENSTQRKGVEHVRLVLNPRIFSTATREQWELYRNQFWSLEAVRRGVLQTQKQEGDSRDTEDKKTK